MAANQVTSHCSPRFAEPATLATGDARRFAELAREHERILLGIALRLCGNRTDACDLVQDTFERGLRSFHRYQEGTNARAWLTTIMGNLFIDRCRSRQRAERAGGTVVPLDEELAARATVEEPEQAPAWAAISVEQVRQALGQLGDGFRKVYELHSLEGYSYNEIAEELGIPRATVGTRLIRARRRLKALLEPQCQLAMAA